METIEQIRLEIIKLEEEYSGELNEENTAYTREYDLGRYEALKEVLKLMEQSK